MYQVPHNTVNAQDHCYQADTCLFSGAFHFFSRISLPSCRQFEQEVPEVRLHAKLSFWLLSHSGLWLSLMTTFRVLQMLKLGKWSWWQPKSGRKTVCTFSEFFRSPQRVRFLPNFILKYVLSQWVSAPTGELASPTAFDNQVNFFLKNGKAFCQMAVWTITFELKNGRKKHHVGQSEMKDFQFSWWDQFSSITF